jgi:hypothetical protein
MLDEARLLLKRLVENIPARRSYWNGPPEKIDDLDNFTPFNDSEIEKIRIFLDSRKEESIGAQCEAANEDQINIPGDEEEDAEFIPEDGRGGINTGFESSLRSVACTEFQLDQIDPKTKEIIRNIFQTEEFQHLAYYQDQVFYIVERCKKNESLLTWEQIGQIFGVSRSAVRSIYDRIVRGKQGHGRPRSFSSDVEAQMTA